MTDNTSVTRLTCRLAARVMPRVGLADSFPARCSSKAASGRGKQQ